MYVGTYNTMKGYRIDASQALPKITATFKLPNGAFNFAIRGGYMYMSSLVGQPSARIDLTNFVAKTMNPPGGVSVAIDKRQIAWFPGDDKAILMCDFELGGNCEAKGAGVNFRGVAVHGAGQLWVAALDLVYKFANEGTTLLGTVPSRNAHGMAIGHDGNPWLNAQCAAYKIESGKVGGPPGPATKDYTGNGMLVPSSIKFTNFTNVSAHNILVSSGEWSVVHDGVDLDSVWSKLLWNLEMEGKIPASTSITLHVRAADTKNELMQTSLRTGDTSSVTSSITRRARSSMKRPFTTPSMRMPSTCPVGETCFDDPSDACDPNKGGADCIGMCLKGRGKDGGSTCSYDDPNQSYVAESLEECAVIHDLCAEGSHAFADDCGCGCELAY